MCRLQISLEKIRRVLKAKESEADSKQITFDMGSHQEQILHAQKKYRMYLHALLGAEGMTVFFLIFTQSVGLHLQYSTLKLKLLFD